MESAEQSAPRKIVLRIGGTDVDFTTVPPITGGDRKALFKEGVDLRKFGSAEGFTPDEEGKIVLHFVRKVHPTATQEQIDEIASTIQNSIVLHFLTQTREVHNPFVSPSSTSSPASTAGDLAS